MQVILQRQRSRNYKKTDYYRYRITIPSKVVKEVGLRGREKLEVSSRNGAIIITRSDCKGLQPKRRAPYRSTPPHFI